MGWEEFEKSVCQVSLSLYRLEEADLRRAEAELRRLIELANHYRRVAEGDQLAGESGSASHLCRTPGHRE